jgi:hypothetical protein
MTATKLGSFWLPQRIDGEIAMNTEKKTIRKASKPAKPEPKKAEPSRATEVKPASRRSMGLEAYIKGAKVRG